MALSALYTDEDISTLVGTLLRSRGLDVTTAPEQATLGTPSNSKFKTSLGHSSPWATIEVNQLARRLDISAHKIFEFGIAGEPLTIGRLS
jgi:hypothetical protein